jgi:aryl-alcohol dehydrogenase-like predicted oxidoreductase
MLIRGGLSMNDNFLFKEVPAFGNRVFRLGLATNYGINGKDLEWAVDNGINYIFWPSTARRVKESLKAVLKHNRESVILATGPSIGWFGEGIKKKCAQLLKTLNIDYIDVFQIFWVGRASAWTPSTIDALVSLKESGMVKAIGISIHDRIRAGKLVKDSPLDMFMIRYNAAHTGAEQDIFPHLAQRKPAVVTYTATRWRALLKSTKGWEGPVMTASDCYRFCLSNPYVDITLTGPKTRQQLEENLMSIREKGLLSDDEKAWMVNFGQTVHNASSRLTFRF